MITQYLTAEEEARLLPILSGRRSHLLDILVIDLHTGMRKREVLSLHKSQVDFLRGRILLTHTKNGKARTVPIPRWHTTDLAAPLRCLWTVRLSVREPANRKADSRHQDSLGRR